MPTVSERSPFNPDGRLVFEKGPHRYSVAARELISVTKVFEEAFPGSLGEDYWTETSRLRGSAIHEAILYYIQNDLNEASLHELIRPYWPGVTQMFADEQPEVLHAEEPIYDEAEGYAGTFDVLCRLHGLRRATTPNVLDLVDAKTGTVPWTVGMQTAAYKRAIQRVYPDFIIRRWAWNLKSNGTYTLTQISQWPDARRHESQFLEALRTTHLKRAHL